MVLTMSDQEIAKHYRVREAVIKSVRTRYDIPRAGDCPNLPWERQPKQLVRTLTWDFGWQNL